MNKEEQIVDKLLDLINVLDWKYETKLGVECFSTEYDGIEYRVYLTNITIFISQKNIIEIENKTLFEKLQEKRRTFKNLDFVLQSLSKIGEKYFAISQPDRDAYCNVYNSIDELIEDLGTDERFTELPQENQMAMWGGNLLLIKGKVV